MARAVVVDCISLTRRVAYLSNNEVWPITNLIDSFGDETDEPEDAVSFVAGRGRQWFAMARPRCRRGDPAMTATVVSIKGGEIENERRATFLQAVAASFDRYVSENGQEPDALVYVMCGLKQPSQIAWDIRGDSMGGPVSVLSLAAVHCLAEAQSGRQGLEG